MRRFWILGLTLVASLAVGAPTAGASYERLTLYSSTSGRIPTGELVYFEDETYSSWGFPFSIDLGDRVVNCDIFVWRGFSVTNGKPADELRITEGNGGQCTAYGTTVEPASVDMNAPLKLKMTAIGLAGISKYEGTKPTITVSVPSLTCTFVAKLLPGDFTPATEGPAGEKERLVVGFEGDRMHRVEHERACPKETGVTFQFTFGGVGLFGEIDQVT